MAVTHARGQQHDGGVGQRGDLDLGLPDADRLDEHDIAPGGVEHAQLPAASPTTRPPRWPRLAIDRM
jgi:hypothetical protein